MRQSKIKSLLESFLNVAIGCLVAIASQILIFPLFDIDVTLADNVAIALCFTLISIVRSYCIRRFFNSAQNPR